MAGGKTETGAVFEPDRPTLYYVEDDADAVALFYTAMRRLKAGFRLEIATGLEQAFDYFAGLQFCSIMCWASSDGGDLLRWMRHQRELVKDRGSCIQRR